MKKIALLLAVLSVFSVSMVAHADPLTFTTSGSTNVTLPTTGTVITESSSSTLTNKTFDANGSGNSLHNVDVSDLADGTAGQLITWATGGAPTTVSTGSSGQVLTSNGAGAAPTFQTPGGSGSSILTLFVQPLLPTSIDTNQTGAFNVNTTASLGEFNVPSSITVNKISIKTGGTITTAGTYDLSVYTEDGQTQKFSVTTASLNSADTIYSTSVSSVTLTPGNYWLMVNPNSTADVSLHSYSGPNSGVFGLTTGLNGDVSSEPAVVGSLTISAGTPPGTFTPTSVSEGNSRLLTARLDN